MNFETHNPAENNPVESELPHEEMAEAMTNIESGNIGGLEEAIKRFGREGKRAARIVLLAALGAMTTMAPEPASADMAIGTVDTAGVVVRGQQRSSVDFQKVIAKTPLDKTVFDQTRQGFENAGTVPKGTFGVVKQQLNDRFENPIQNGRGIADNN